MAHFVPAKRAQVKGRKRPEFRSVQLFGAAAHAAELALHGAFDNSRQVRVEPLAQGDAVALSFTAPTLWDPLLLRGRVAWVKGPARRAGVAFEHRAADAVFALYELIAQNPVR